MVLGGVRGEGGGMRIVYVNAFKKCLTPLVLTQVLRGETIASWSFVNHVKPTTFFPVIINRKFVFCDISIKEVTGKSVASKELSLWYQICFHNPLRSPKHPRQESTWCFRWVILLPEAVTIPELITYIYCIHFLKLHLALQVLRPIFLYFTLTSSRILFRVFVRFIFENIVLLNR